MAAKRSKTLWSLAGMFMIVLILILPIYSASSLAAAVQITKNSGEAGIERFIDAEGDVWTIQVLITRTNEQSINPERVKLKLENNQAKFSSCTSSDFGITCEYISPLTDGVKEDEHDFTVAYELGGIKASSNSEVIKADGSAPFVESLNVRQDGTDLVLDFIVSDKYSGKPSVGIKTIEIIDAENNVVLETIIFPEPGTESYNHINDGDFGGVLQNQLTGEGKRQIKLRMEDWLGHSNTEFASTFQTDFVAPVITDYLNLTNLGEFIGNIVVTTDIIVGIQGEANLQSVLGYSEQSNLDGKEAVLIEENDEQGILYYAWKDVEIFPQGAFTLKVVAEDTSGNVAEKVLTKSLISDVSAPVVEFFGSDRVFNGQSYVQDGNQKIILIASDQGSWITEDGVRANLVALGGSSYQPPTECQQIESSFVCIWKLSKRFESSGIARISLSEFNDRAGNQGEMPEVEIVMDSTGPKVESIEFYGSSGQDKNYFQSNDRIKLELTALESSGLFVMVDLNNLVMDAETLFPLNYVQENVPHQAGWQVFTQDECEISAEGKWECVFETAPLKSGPDKDVGLEIMVMDTAGNPASVWEKEPKNVQGSKGNYKLDLLGLTDEVSPDYWEVSDVDLLVPFVDLDVAELNYGRMPLTVKLQSDNSRARALSVELLDCVEGAENSGAEAVTSESSEEESGAESASAAAEVSVPVLSRNLLYGGNFPDGKADPMSNLILEFSPFKAGDYFVLEDNFEQATAKYTCQLLVYSRVNDQALANPEIQQVVVEVPFSFSTLGSMDESVKQKIEAIWDETFMEIAEVLAVMEDVIGWLNWLLSIAQLLLSIDTFITLVSETQKGAAQVAQEAVKAAAVAAGVSLGTSLVAIPPLEALEMALRGNCLAIGESTTVLHEILSIIQIPASILSCDPNPTIDMGFYGWWQRGVLETYNAMSARSLLGQPAGSLYDNIYTSMLGLCVPGIIHNLNKLREVNCRQIVCYGQEVPSGIATMESCDRLHDLQICEFWAGPALDFTPLGGISVIGRMLKAAFTSPVGLINVAEIGTCFALCFDETPATGLITACKIIKGITTVIQFIDSIATIIESPPWEDSGSTTYFCDQAEAIDLEALAG